MFKKYLIVASKKDKAGINITTNLSQFADLAPGKFKFYLVDDEIIYTENLDLEKINEFDFIIFASKHASSNSFQPRKTLSIHAPGNFRTADFGGIKERVSRSSALFQKQLFETLHKTFQEHQLRDFNLTLEATHHGPLINKPCVFIEIGSTENEWKNRKAGFIIAKTILDTIENFKENPYNEVAIGIGGPHYCPNFNQIQLESNYAISHIIPQYVFPLKPEFVLEAINKTSEEVDLAIVDWKGLGNAEERDRVVKILEDNYIRWEKTSEIKKEI